MPTDIRAEKICYFSKLCYFDHKPLTTSVYSNMRKSHNCYNIKNLIQFHDMPEGITMTNNTNQTFFVVKGHIESPTYYTWVHKSFQVQTGDDHWLLSIIIIGYLLCITLEECMGRNESKDVVMLWLSTGGIQTFLLLFLIWPDSYQILFYYPADSRISAFWA